MKHQEVYMDIRIEPHTFTDAAGRVFNARCTIKHKGQTEVHGAIDARDLFPMIEEGKPLQLSNAVVFNFSANDYRKWAGLGDSDIIHLHDVLAINTWFYAEGGKAIDFSFCTFKGIAAQFAGARFIAREVTFLRSDFTEADADFTNSRFLCEHATFQYSRFEGAGTSFENSLFEGDTLTFVNASFRSPSTVFRNSRFLVHRTEFHFSKFGDGNVSFDKCLFSGDLDFRKIELGKGKLEFRRCDFRGEENNFSEIHGRKTKTSFNRSKFKSGTISFEKTDMPQNELNFDHVDFGTSSLSFFASVQKAITITGSQLNGYTDLRVEKCDVIDLQNCVIRDVLDMKHTETSMDIQELRLPGVRNLGMIIADWEGNTIFRLVSYQKGTTDFEKSEQFRIFKEAFHKTGLYEDEDKAYVEFKRFELSHNHSRRVQQGGWSKIFSYPNKWFQQIVFDKMGLYATDPLRVLVSILVVYSLFSLAYYVMIITGWGEVRAGADPPENLSDLAVAFYHSAITFFTVGYGDYSPWGAARIVAMFEGFTGVFMMAYFTVAFVRKILR